MGRRGGSDTCGEERRGKKGSVVGTGMLKQSSSGSLSPQLHSRSSSGVRVMLWSRNSTNLIIMWVVLGQTYTNTRNTSILPGFLSFQVELVDKFKLMKDIFLLLFWPYEMQFLTVGDIM